MTSKSVLDFIGVALIGYFAYTVMWLRSPLLHKDIVLGATPNDVTRWRHMGDQPQVWYNGNAAPVRDTTVPAIRLAFSHCSYDVECSHGIRP